MEGIPFFALGVWISRRAALGFLPWAFWAFRPLGVTWALWSCGVAALTRGAAARLAPLTGAPRTRNTPAPRARAAPPLSLPRRAPRQWCWRRPPPRRARTGSGRPGSRARGRHRADASPAARGGEA